MLRDEHSLELVSVLLGFNRLEKIDRFKNVHRLLPPGLVNRHAVHNLLIVSFVGSAAVVVLLGVEQPVQSD